MSWNESKLIMNFRFPQVVTSINITEAISLLHGVSIYKPLLFNIARTLLEPNTYRIRMNVFAGKPIHYPQTIYAQRMRLC